MAEEPSRSTPALVGRVLGGRYDVVRLLGRGGMGEVYEGNHRLLSKRVAIKVLSAGLAADDNQRKRFLREARSANLIEHDNVVSIIDFGDDEPTYFVMEFLEGDDLHALVEREGGLRWTRARGIILQIAAALGAAHALGIVHRDVKPSNCFVLRRGTKVDFVKVLDFGIAKVTEASGDSKGLTRTHELMGTVAYMAPEQALGERVDARTDIYALGVVLYEMLTGNVPFSGTNSYQVLDQHVRKAPPEPEFVDATIPAAVRSVILRALEKDPAKRFQSMEELAQAVMQIESSATVAPTPSSELHVAAPPEPGSPPTEPLAAFGPPPSRATDPLSTARPPQNPVTGQNLGRLDEQQHETSPPFRDRPTSPTLTAPTGGGGLRLVLIGVGIAAAIGGGVVIGTRLTQKSVGAQETVAAAPASSPEPIPPPTPADAAPPSEPTAEVPVVATADPMPSPSVAAPAAPAVPPTPTEADAEPAVLPPSDVAPPKTSAPRPTAKPKEKAAKTYDAIAASVRKKARSRCEDGASGSSVEVSFLVNTEGLPMMVKAIGANARSSAANCLVELVKATKFNATDAGRHIITL